MTFSLKGVAYITGAGSGIGQYAAYSMARLGVRSFALLDRNSVTETASYLKKEFPSTRVLEIQLDVSDEGAVNDSVEKTVQEFGRLDFAVNNAGIGGAGQSTDQIEKSDFDRVMSVNTTGVWLCQRAQIRQMLKQEKMSDSYRSYRGSIVNTASMYGLIGPSKATPATAYSTSKHAVVGLTKADAIAFAPKGIKINAVCPGYVLTPLIKQHMSAGNVLEDERRRIPLERMASMEEIGDMIAFLHSDASSYMVGACLVADGGLTIQ